MELPNSEDDREIEINLNQFNFDGVVLEDLRKYIVEETEIGDLFCFFMELFSYCRETRFQFEKTREISMISFVLENMEEITSVVEKEPNCKILKNIFMDVIICFILESDNTQELIGLFTLVKTNYLSLFLDSLQHWEIIQPKQRAPLFSKNKTVKNLSFSLSLDESFYECSLVLQKKIKNLQEAIEETLNHRR